MTTPRALMGLRESAALLAAAGHRAVLEPSVQSRFARCQRDAVAEHRAELSQAQLNQIQAITMLLDRITAKQLWSSESQRTAESWKRVRMQAQGLLREM